MRLCGWVNISLRDAQRNSGIGDSQLNYETVTK